MGRMPGRRRLAKLPRWSARRSRGLLWLVLAAGALNCRCGDRMEQQPPGGVGAVPIIRVRLTARPVRQLTISTTGGYRLDVDGQPLAESAAPLDPTLITRAGASWRLGNLGAEGGELVLRPVPGGYLRVGRTVYRGHLRLLPAAGDDFIAVNHVDIESYLAGVLPRELYPTWEPEAYRALAVAARTFALVHMTTVGTRNDYDLGDSQASQVYAGLSAETGKSVGAVRSTYGIVLAFGEEGKERIFMTQYSACCGGRVNGAYVIRKANRIQPLMGGQVCEDCMACSRYRWPTVRVPKTLVHRALLGRYRAAAGLGGVRTIRVVSTTDYGRAVWVDVVGTTGRKLRLRAEDVRLALVFSRAPAARRLYSMNCEIRDAGQAIEFHNGRGFGHGVGLCQWGAQGKAEKGWTGEQILHFYYPGAKLFRVY